jgi:hypothetical protein
VFVAATTMRVMPSWTPLAWDLSNAAWAVLYAATAAVFAWLLWLGMKNHGSAERGAKRVLKQVAALGAVAVVAMLAFAAAARAEVLAPRRSVDVQIRTQAAFDVDPDLPEQLRAAAATVWPRASEETTVRLERTRLPSAAEAGARLN